jgi:hypothetical protein
VDPTPEDDSEFDGLPAAGIADRADLLTVLVHELGHVLGLEDDYEADPYTGSVMAWALPLGVRRIRLDEAIPTESRVSLENRVDRTFAWIEEHFAIWNELQCTQLRSIRRGNFGASQWPG